MAIYSLNVSSVGRTTHAPGTAGAHIRYIARPDAQPVLISGGGLSTDPHAARAALDRAERADRKNARVIDKIRIALPVELPQAQRTELARIFAERLTARQVPWFGAIHQSGDDQHNPHLHLVIRDRDQRSGKRVVRLSDSARDWKAAGKPGDAPCAYLRQLWEETCNAFLSRDGHACRIDRRTLEAQGIDRTPQIHLGPRGQYIETNKDRPDSKARTERAWRRTQYRDNIPYPDIDGGRTRREHNETIIDFNLERAARSRDFATRSWARFEKEQAALDRALATQHRIAARAEDKDLEAARLVYRALRTDIIQRRAEALARVKAAHASSRDTRLDQLATRHHRERTALHAQQARLFQRLKRIFDPTGGTARAQDAQVRTLQRQQNRERRAALHDERALAQEAARETKRQFRTQIAQVRHDRSKALALVRSQHNAAVIARQAQWQEREHHREEHRQEMAAWIAQQAKRENARAKRVELYEQARKVYAPEVTKTVMDSKKVVRRESVKPEPGREKSPKIDRFHRPRGPAP